MRDIKFRAWDKENKNWVDDVLLTCNKYGFLFQDLGRCEFAGEDRKIELCQFTGLLDKNGKEIYEGDIGLFDCAGGKIKSTIIWNSFVGRYERDDIPYLASGINGLCEIIGNIYEENPELLRKE